MKTDISNHAKSALWYLLKNNETIQNAMHDNKSAGEIKSLIDICNLISISQVQP